MDGAAALQALTERAEANEQEFFRAMARVSPVGAIHEEDGLLLVRTGPLLPMLNLAALSRVPADPVATLARALAFFAPYGLRFMLSTHGRAAEAIAPFAAAAGMEPSTSPGMLLTPLAGAPPDVPGLEIRAVADAEALRLYNDTMTAGFGGGPWALPEITADARLLSALGITHYLGYLGGRPVATAARISSHGVAGVFNVSTLPAYRRRGIGEALTWRAALGGREEGCISSYLQASELGLSIYRRMGYRHVLTYQRWLSPG